MTPEELEQIANDEREAQASVPQKVNVCVAAGCLSCQSQAVKEALDKEVARRGLGSPLQGQRCGLHGVVRRGTLGLNQQRNLYKRVAAT